MGDEIRAGDAVLCVDARTPFATPRFPAPATILVEGRVYRARDVRLTSMYVDAVDWAVEQRRFRKLRPADEAFTRMMSALLPAARTSISQP